MMINQPSVHVPHAPTCSSTTRRHSIPVEFSRLSHQESVIHHRLSRSSQSATRRMSKETSTVHFQESALLHSYDSRRVSTAPSLFSELVDLRKSLEENEHNRPIVVKSDSRAFSVLSEQSSHFSCTNKDLINDAYDKYDSFTPFKTPLQSKHQLNRTGTEQSQRRSLDVPQPAQRLAVSPSLHDMEGILEASVHPKKSFSTHRSISPSRNFSRHQKSSAYDITPAEIKISKVQLRCKSPIKSKIEEPVYNSLPHYDTQEESPRIEPMPSRESQNVPPPTPVHKTSVTSNSSSVPASLQPSPNDSVDSIILKNVDGTQQEIVCQFFNKPTDSNDQVLEDKAIENVYRADIQPQADPNVSEEPANSEEPRPLESDTEKNEVVEESDYDRKEVISSPESINETDVLVSTTSLAEGQGNTEEIPMYGSVHSSPFQTQEEDRQNLQEKKEKEAENHSESDKDLLTIQSTNSLDTQVVSTTGCLSPSECQIKVHDIETKISDTTLRGLTSPVKNEDLIDGLSLDLNLDEDILKALDNIDDFVLDLSDDEDED